MKNSKIILLILLSFMSCKSHQKVEVVSASDSCSSITTLQHHSLSEIQKAESISSHLSHNHMEFQDHQGEIHILPDGQITIKGLKSALISKKSHQKSSQSLSSSRDTVCITSSTQSVSSLSSAIHPEAAPPQQATSIRQKLLLLIALLLMIPIIYKSVKYGSDK